MSRYCQECQEFFTLDQSDNAVYNNSEDITMRENQGQVFTLFKNQHFQKKAEVNN